MSLLPINEWYKPFKMVSAYNISLAKAKATGDPEVEKLANLLKTEYIDKGKIGREAGEGFYKYPNPNFAKPDFLRG